MIDDNELVRLTDWLWEAGGATLLDELVPESHPARAWVNRDGSAYERFRALIGILANGGHLPLLAALVLRARTIMPLPPEVDRALASALAWWDGEIHRPRNAQEPAELFVCYAHEDGPRIGAIVQALREAGFSVFRDVESIPPGVSIAAAVADAIASCRAAIVVVSAASIASSWVTREVALLMPGRFSGARPIYPVVIDDVLLPPPVNDLFAIDLRGLDATTPYDVVARRMEPLIRMLHGGKHEAGVLLQS